MLLSSFAAVSFLFTTLGGYIVTAPVVDLKEDRDGVWLVEVWHGGHTRPRDRNGQLSRQFISVLFTDAKAKDPLSGRLLIDELREALQSRRSVPIRFHRNEGYGVITVVKPERAEGVPLRIDDVGS